MNKENIPILIFAVALTALLAGGGIYWWQQSNLATVKNEMQQQGNELQQQIDNLQNQLSQITTEKNELQQQINELNKKPEQYVKVISPNGGETVCLNEDFSIDWESKGVDTVGLRLIKQEFGGTNYYYIGFNAVSATTSNEENIPGKGEAVWRVKNIPAGDGYKLEIMSAENPKIIDTSDSTFSIDICKG